MDTPDVFRHVEGFGQYQPQRSPQSYTAKKPGLLRKSSNGDNDGEASHRIAHTLTACCRCRQVSFTVPACSTWRPSASISPLFVAENGKMATAADRAKRKTRCDPTLPRCLPCERSGSVCEYFDTTKGKKISRYYVVKLQEKVRALEAELGQFTEEEDFPRNNEELLRPGGLVRLNESDETPRYLGPSSGIAMTRMVMEEAKRYTDSSRISELVPSVRDRRPAAAPDVTNGTAMRSMSFSIPLSASSRKKSFPMISGVPAVNLPSRVIVDRLLEVYQQRGKQALGAIQFTCV